MYKQVKDLFFVKLLPPQVINRGRFILVSCLLAFCCISLHAQTNQAVGKKFYTTFTNIANTSDSKRFEFLFTSTQSGTATITFPGDLTRTVSVTKDTPNSYILTTDDINSLTPLSAGFGALGGNGIKIESTVPMTVVMRESINGFGDASLVFPTDILGNNYMTISYPSTPQPCLYLVSSNDNNTITLNEGISGTIQERGVICSVNETEVLKANGGTGVRFSCTQTSTMQVAGKNLAIGGTSTNSFTHQLLSTDRSGTEFLIPVTRQGRIMARITAISAGTSVSYTGESSNTVTLSNAGDYIDVYGSETSKGIYINASKPIMVGTFMLSNDAQGVTGYDPGFSYAPSLKQFAPDALIGVSASNSIAPEYALILVHSSAKNDLSLSYMGSAPYLLTDIAWSDHISGYSYCNFPISNIKGNYLFSNPSGLIVYLYGNANADTEASHSNFYLGTIGNSAATAKTVDVPLPDNVIIGECVVPFQPIQFKIKQQWQAVNAAHCNTGPLVGDLDGDGIPEIITISETTTSINVTNGQTGQLKASISIPTENGSGGWLPVITAALADADKNGKGEIILATSDGKLRSFEAQVTGGVFSLAEKWGTTFTNPTAADFLPQPIVTDFNGDGTPEVLVYNQIFNAVTGSKMGETEAIATAYCGRNPYRVGNVNSNFIATADFDGDGLPEIAAGGKIYKVTISGSTATCSTIYSNSTIKDGYTAVADIDMDGNLDVVVVEARADGSTWLNVWSPLTNTVISQFQIYSNPTYNAQSYPFIGDIDGVTDASTGKKYPEICVTIVNAVKAYKYDSATKTMVAKWSLPTSDASGGTGITLFDFNNDGISELVYRDQTLLRILNGAADATPVLADATASITCNSGTAFEYPVIADTDGDGSANICVTSSAGYGVAPHYLNVYESATQPWAPTRKVWNQVNYDPTQINENLTVPARYIPKNSVFNGKAPYNGALFQVPIVDENFDPIVEAADPAIDSLWVETISPTMARVMVRISNLGAKFTNTSLPVALYGTLTPPTTPDGTQLAVKQVGTSIAPENKATIYFEVPVSSIRSGYSVRIQDDGVNYPALGSFLDCEYGNNTQGVTNVIAFPDIFVIPMSGSSSLSPLNNDLTGTCTNSTVTTGIISNSGPYKGYLSFDSANNLIYTPSGLATGIDSVDYTISCSGTTSQARIYFYILPDINRICYGTSSVNIKVNDPSANTVVNWTYNAADTHGKTPGSDANTLSTSIASGNDIFRLDASARMTISNAGIDTTISCNNVGYTLNVVPALMYWKKDASDNNWNNPGNWGDADGTSFNSVPMACTSVHIPGDAVNYPSLDSVSTIRTVIYGDPVCDSIVYHFGSEVAKPHYLTYEKALIQYNFGYYDASNKYQTDGDSYSATPMNRGQWYALSAPLKKIASGDFSLGGYPNTWQQGFVRSNMTPNGFSGLWNSPDNTNALDISGQWNAISVWVGEYLPNTIGEGDGYHTNLNALKGILEMPYFENKTISDLHRIHTYNGTTSEFSYYNSDRADLQILTDSTPGSMVRGQEAYRFIFDGELVNELINDKNTWVYKVSVPAGKEIMIGNPFISSLNFRTFYELNPGKMDAYYRLYAKNVWTEYSYAAGSQTLNEYIAPLQAFFISTLGSSGNIDLFFPPEMVSVTRPTGSSNQLKSSAEEDVINDVLYVTAKNNDGENSVMIGLNNSQEKNIVKLFSDDYLNVPQIYLLDMAQSKNAVQFTNNYNVEIPLGIRSTSQDLVELSFHNIENCNAESLVLFDKILGKRTDLLLNDVYKFKNNSSEDIQNRFIIEVGSPKSPTSIDRTIEGKVNTYIQDKILYIKSDLLIQEITINNTQGLQIARISNFGGYEFAKELPNITGVYIIRVKTENGSTSINKLIMK